MLQLSLDPGINAVFQFQHGRQRKLHLCVTRRGAFPAWCVWSTHVQSRVFSRPDPRGGWNLARGREKKAGADQGEIICPKKELLFGELQTDGWPTAASLHMQQLPALLRRTLWGERRQPQMLLVSGHAPFQHSPSFIRRHRDPSPHPMAVPG